MSSVEYNRQYYEANKERLKEASRRRYREDPIAHRATGLQRKFGISLEQYEEMERRQDGRCAICGQKCKSGRRLAVDHNHKTGAVRDLLCQHCNQALGFLGDDTHLMRVAIAYLERHDRA